VLLFANDVRSRVLNFAQRISLFFLKQMHIHIHIVKNKYLNALLVLMLFSAIAHMAVLFILALASGGWQELNYFNILDINTLFPNFLTGFGGNIISWLIAAGLYIAILKLNKREPAHPRVVPREK
jgi:hypothetical protein